MAKTGYKYTKQQPSKGSRNMVVKSAASSKQHRVAPKSGNARSAATIARLKMYNNGKAIRNKEGKVVGGQFMMADRAGDTKITAATGRIAPDRRWFGNTRVVAASDLDRFREEMTESMADPYSVVVKRKALPMGLLRDAAELEKRAGAKGSALLVSEPFEGTFGAKSQRKRVKVEQLMAARVSRYDDDNNTNNSSSSKNANLMQQLPTVGGQAEAVPQLPTDDAAGYASLLAAAQQSQQTYTKVNNRVGMVGLGRDTDQVQTSGLGIDYRLEKKDDLFLKGQSKRIWGEFYKVLDCSDVILHVIDARNVPGTRCTMVEKHIKNAPHKHLVFVLNKIDLVPNWVAKRWIGELSQIRPTIAFHASMTHAFGKGALISLLRQFGKLSDKKQISVGVIGYPNVGKSSVINTLISKKSCKVAPVPGETKIWQYITLFRNVSLIDCPGVVVDTAGDTETDSVLKGVVRSERLECPEDYVEAICNAVKREHIAAMYGLAKSGEESWSTPEELLEKISLKCGRLRKGGEPCLRSSAIMLINDYQRGRLPHYVAPPELKESDEEKKVEETAVIRGVKLEEQNLDGIERSVEVEEAKGSDAVVDGGNGDEDDREDVGENEASESDNEDDAPVSLAIKGADEWD
jgi:nuclear GTP-binding protein